MTAAQALAQALVAHQPRYYGEPGYWPEAVGKIADAMRPGGLMGRGRR